MRPPFPYYGGKQNLADQIVALLPDHQHYVEPYAGGLSVLLAKPRSRFETVNDLDQELVTFWRVLRDQREELEVACALTPHARAEYEAAHQPCGDPVETARRVWVRLTQGRSARTSVSGWRYFGKPTESASMADYLRGYRERLRPAADRLMGVSLECREAAEVIGDYGRHPGVLLYVDPPYLGSTRSGSGYRHEMRDPKRHEALAAALHECTAAVLLSGYPSPLYDELYAGWHRTELSGHTGQGGRGRRTVEVIWSNVPLGHRLDLFTEDEAS